MYKTMISKAMVSAAGVLAVMLAMMGTAAADEGPHGGFTATTGKCQGCHSPHRASSIYILRGGTGTIGSFCTTCHSASGDAHTDVLDGQWTTGKALWGVPDTYGDTTRQLNGGRFTGATATHSVLNDPIGATVWGGDNLTGADITLSSAFTCTSCHDPHGKSLADVGGSGAQANGSTDNYRLLKNAPVKSWESSANYGTGVTKSYTRAAWRSGTTASDGMTGFCGSCHADYVAEGSPSSDLPNRPSMHGWAHQVDQYLSTGALASNLNSSSYKLPVEQTNFVVGFGKYYSTDSSAPTASGAAGIYKTNGSPASFNTSTDKVTCTTCHNPHGSVAVEGQGAKSALNAAGDPSLLRFDNRTVCQSCHRKGF